MRSFGSICRVLLLSVIFGSFASCSPSPQAGGGIGGTGSVATIASGPVTKFGSVFVSGTEYDNTNTLYCIDHEPCSRENRLRIGMVVLVNGTRSEEYTTNQTLTRIADKITYEETVEGFVQSVAADGLSLVVLGQMVSVNQKTEIDPSLQGATPHTLNTTTAPGAVVEVSGFVTGDGTILATLILQETGTPHYEIEGFVKNHNVANRTFEIGSLAVDYSPADISQMPSPTSRVWDGMVVFIQGDQWSQGGPGPYGARLTATRVKPQGLGATDILDAEVEDFITQVVGPGDFFVNNVHVQTPPFTTYEGGTANDLVIGAHVEMNGSLVNDILQATHISFENETELESNVATIDTSAKTLTLVGFSGVIIALDGRTAIDGEGNASRLEDLQAGDHLKIHGRRGTGGTMLATEIERGAPTSKVKLEGLLTSVFDPLLVIAGVTIDTTAIPGSGFKGREGVVIGRNAFFAGLSIGKKVAIQGNMSGMMVQWSSASHDD